MKCSTIRPEDALLRNGPDDLGKRILLSTRFFDQWQNPTQSIHKTLTLHDDDSPEFETMSMKCMSEASRLLCASDGLFWPCQFPTLCSACASHLSGEFREKTQLSSTLHRDVKEVPRGMFDARAPERSSVRVCLREVHVRRCPEAAMQTKWMN